MAAVTIPGIELAKYLRPKLTTLLLQRTSFLRAECSTRGHSLVLLKLEDDTASRLVRAPQASESTGKEESYLVTWNVWSWLPRVKTGCCSTMRTWVCLEYGWYPWNVLIIPRPVTKVNVKQQSNTCWIATSSYHSGIKFWVTLPGEEPLLASASWEQREIKNREWK